MNSESPHIFTGSEAIEIKIISELLDERPEFVNITIERKGGNLKGRYNLSNEGRNYIIEYAKGLLEKKEIPPAVQATNAKECENVKQLLRERPDFLTKTIEEGGENLKGRFLLSEDGRKKMVAYAKGLDKGEKKNTLVEKHGELNPKVSDSRTTSTCPGCSQTVRVPSDKGTLRVTCPKCHLKWEWSPLDRRSKDSRKGKTATCFTSDTSLDELIDSFINGKKSGVKGKACTTLRDRLRCTDDTQAIERLLPLFMGDKSCEVQSIYSVIGAAVVPYMIEILGNDNSDARHAALSVLGNINDISVFPPLAEALRDTDERIRLMAITGLSQKPFPQITELLIGALKDNCDDVRLSAIEGLCTRKEHCVVRSLVLLLDDATPRVKERATQALGEIGDPMAFEPLISASSDNDKDVRIAAIVALGQIGDTRVVDPFILLTSDKDKSVRMAAIVALGQTGDIRAVDPLISLCSDTDEDVSWEAIMALGKTGNAKAVPTLISFLRIEAQRGNRQIFGTQSGEYIRAEKALCQIMDPLAVEILIAAVTDSDENVRCGVLKALGHHGKRVRTDRSKQTQPSVLSSIFETLIKALGDENSKVRLSSLTALGEVGGPLVVIPLANALKTNDKSVCRAAAEGLLGEETDEGKKQISQALTDWRHNQLLGEVLDGLSWEPENDTDRIHYLVARRRGYSLRDEGKTTQQVLLKDIESGDQDKIENALFAFIGVGMDDMIPTLCSLLQTNENKIMAETYLNCDHPNLALAATEWAEARGYSIKKGEGARSVSWKRW